MSNRIIIPDILSKKRKTNIVAVTCYTAQFSKIFDKYADILLVGDSLGMVVYGHDDTTKVSIKMMIEHAKAVVRTTKNSLVVVDLPFGSYESSKKKAFKTATKVLKKTGANAVKIEGGIEIYDTISFLVKRGIPVMGHVGLLPQRIKNLGKFSVAGQSFDDEKNILNDAIACEKAGAFALVIEAVKENLGKKITNSISIPSIGIGAGRYCDGQILVSDDLLGLYRDFQPKFVKRYTNLSEEIETAFKKFSKEVIEGIFPGDDNVYK